MQTGPTRNCQTHLATNNTDNTEGDGLTVALDAAEAILQGDTTQKSQLTEGGGLTVALDAANAVPQGDIKHESQLAEGDALTVAPGAAGVFAKVELRTILNGAAVVSSIIH